VRKEAARESSDENDGLYWIMTIIHEISRKMLGDLGIAHEPLDIDMVQEAKQVGQPGSSVGGGHGFGHRTRWNRCEQARRSETCWTAERR
jgi:hypothetical protein